jgi:hypothetical protein
MPALNIKEKVRSKMNTSRYRELSLAAIMVMVLIISAMRSGDAAGETQRLDATFIRSVDFDKLLAGIRPDLSPREERKFRDARGTSHRFTGPNTKLWLDATVGIFASEAEAHSSYVERVGSIASAPELIAVKLGDEVAGFKSRHAGGTIVFRRRNCVVEMSTTLEWEQFLQAAQEIDAALKREGPHVSHAVTVERMAFDLEPLPADLGVAKRIAIPLVIKGSMPVGVAAAAEALHGSANVVEKDGQLALSYLAPGKPCDDQIKITVFAPGYAIATKVYGIHVRNEGKAQTPSDQ